MNTEFIGIDILVLLIRPMCLPIMSWCKSHLGTKEVLLFIRNSALSGYLLTSCHRPTFISWICTTNPLDITDFMNNPDESYISIHKNGFINGQTNNIFKNRPIVIFNLLAFCVTELAKILIVTYHLLNSLISNTCRNTCKNIFNNKTFQGKLELNVT